jgi:hypothetical protein
MFKMRLTRRRLAGCVLLALAAIAGGAWWLVVADRPGRLTRANYSRIRFPATYDEVVAAIGPPHRDEWKTDSAGDRYRLCCWATPLSCADVVFDGTGRAESGAFAEYAKADGLRYWWQVRFNSDPPF